MSGKHDRSHDGEQSAKLLLTGPIVIRGLGRSVKDALLPGNPSRHRAFAGEDGDPVEAAPDTTTPVAGATGAEGRPSSDIVLRSTARPDVASFPSTGVLTQTGVAVGPEEDRVNARTHDAVPGGGVAQDPGDPGPVDVQAHAGLVAAGDVALAEDGTAAAGSADDGQGTAPAHRDELHPQSEDGEAAVIASTAAESELLTGDAEPVDLTDAAARADGPTGESRAEEDAADEGGVDEHAVDDGGADERASREESVDEELAAAADLAVDARPADEESGSDGTDTDTRGDDPAWGVIESESPPEEAGEAVEAAEVAPTEVDDREALSDVGRDASYVDAEPSGDVPVAGSGADPTIGTVPESAPADGQDPVSPAGGPMDEADGTDGPVAAADASPADEGSRSSTDSRGDGMAADAVMIEEDVAVGKLVDSSGGAPVGEVAPDASAVELLSSDATGGADVMQTELAPQDPVEAGFVGDRGWTTAEELYGRPVARPFREADQDAAHDEESGGGAAASIQADEPSGAEGRLDAVQTSASDPDVPLGEEPSPSGSDGPVDEEEQEGLPQQEESPEPDDEQDGDPFDEAFLVPDELEQSGTPLVLQDDVSPSALVPESHAVEPATGGARSGERTTMEQPVADLAAEPSVEASPEGPAAAEGTDAVVEVDRDAAADDPAADAGPEGPDDGGATAWDPDQQAHEPSPAGESALPPGPAQPATAGPAVPMIAAGAAAVAAAVRSARNPSSAAAGGSRRPRGPRPLRERFSREAVGIAVLVVLALVCGGLITAVVLKTQRDAAVAASEAADYTPPPLTMPTPAATGPAVAVIGDGTTSAAAGGVTSAERWTALLASATDGTVSTDASSGMGYSTKGESAQTFVKAAARVPSNAEVVIVFGGTADASVAPLSLAKAATDTYSAVRKQAPDAKLIVVGPAITAGLSDSELTQVRETLRSAAAIAKATWVDPIDLGWLPAAKRSASSPSALTASDEKTLAAEMDAAVKKALD